MTEEIIIDGINVAGCIYYKQECIANCGMFALGDFKCEGQICLYKQLKRLEQENKSLDEEKNCLHKIIDRLLENAGYSKDIASAEDFEDVYEDMQIKRNELIELEQENENLKKDFSSYENDIEDWVSDNSILYQYDDRTPDTLEELQACMESTYEQWQKYKQALEEIKNVLKEICKEECDYTEPNFCGDCDCRYGQILDEINEVL